MLIKFHITKWVFHINHDHAIVDSGKMSKLSIFCWISSFESIGIDIWNILKYFIGSYQLKWHFYCDLYFDWCRSSYIRNFQVFWNVPNWSLSIDSKWKIRRNYILHTFTEHCWRKFVNFPAMKFPKHMQKMSTHKHTAKTMPSHLFDIEIKIILKSILAHVLMKTTDLEN